MESMKKDDVWTSRARRIALAVFALAAGAAGRVLADPAAPGPASIDDAQIVSRVLAMNRAEERTAQSVKGKFVSAAVWQLADRIQVDHADLDREFRRLAPDAEKAIEDGATDAQEGPDLSKLSGDELEKAYVDREVKSHRAMLATLDRDLIPSARSAALRERLVDARAELAAQLQQARNVQHAEWVRQAAAEERADISKEISNEGP